MSRRRRRTDALGEKIARMGLTADLNKALFELTDTAWIQLRSLLERDEPIEHFSPLLSRVRQDRELFELLRTYYDDRKPRLEGHCLTCTQPLPPRAPGAAGRPAEYCRSACRQKAYRDRHHKEERYQEMLRTSRTESWRRRDPFAGRGILVTPQLEDMLFGGRRRAQIEERERRRASVRAKKVAERQNRLPPDGV